VDKQAEECREKFLRGFTGPGVVGAASGLKLRWTSLKAADGIAHQNAQGQESGYD
jgi:hypothetical protein